MDAFFGFETNEYINTGVGFGAIRDCYVVKVLLKEYDSLLDGKSGTIGCPELNTKALVKVGLVQNGQKQIVGGAMIYPASYFNPYDDATGQLYLTEDTYSIHWYAKSWMDKKTVLRSILTKPLHRIFGTEFFRKKR